MDNQSGRLAPLLGEGSGSAGEAGAPVSKKKSRSSRDAAAIKRRCVSTACIACRKRKSKCDGNTPSCAACSSVYGTECIYDPNSDHRRKGVYRERSDNLRTRESTLRTIIQAIIDADEDDVPALVRQIRSSNDLDEVAERVSSGTKDATQFDTGRGDAEDEDSILGAYKETHAPTFETELSGKMGELRLENGSIRFIGGTSNLIYLTPGDEDKPMAAEHPQQQVEPILSWTTVSRDTDLVLHLLNMYLTWHYPYFTTLSKSLFLRDFLLGKPPGQPKRTLYCSSLLVNAMLALGCHFTNSPAGCADPNDPSTKGDAFFAEAKRLIMEDDSFEKPRLTTVQALALMSVREAGCGREAKGWVYSGMSFRMALDMGLNLDSSAGAGEKMDPKEIDARRITFWGCFLFDKCWSNYLGRLPQLPTNVAAVPKFGVWPDEEAEEWRVYTDQGVSSANAQPARTRTIALELQKLCEISGDLLTFFYHPNVLERAVSKSQEVKRLSEFHKRLETWRRELPKEFEAKEGQLPQVLLMQMFFQLLYIHLFRPFLRYSPQNSPLPATVSPRKICLAAAAAISKLMRLYKRTYGLRQICNIAVYIVHSACTIHLLNLPEKNAQRDLTHGVRQLEEIAEDWLCARRTLSLLSGMASKWNRELPSEVVAVLDRTDRKYGKFEAGDIPSPKSAQAMLRPPAPSTSPASAKEKYTPEPQLAYSIGAGNGSTPDAYLPNIHALSPTIQISSAVQNCGTNEPLPPNGRSFTKYNGSNATSPLINNAASNPQHDPPSDRPQQQYEASLPYQMQAQSTSRGGFQPAMYAQYQVDPSISSAQYVPRLQNGSSHVQKWSQFPQSSMPVSGPYQGVSAPNTVPPFLPISVARPQQLPGNVIDNNSQAPSANSNANSTGEQNWWLQDQASLAVGFENWEANLEDGGMDLAAVMRGLGGT